MNDIHETLKERGGYEICPSTASYLSWLTEKLHNDGSLPDGLDIDHEFFADKGDIQLLLLKKEVINDMNEDKFKGIHILDAYKLHSNEYNQLHKK